MAKAIFNFLLKITVICQWHVQILPRGRNINIMLNRKFFIFFREIGIRMMENQLLKMTLLDFHLFSFQIQIVIFQRNYIIFMIVLHPIKFPIFMTQNQLLFILDKLLSLRFEKCLEEIIFWPLQMEI